MPDATRNYKNFRDLSERSRQGAERAVRIDAYKRAISDSLAERARPSSPSRRPTGAGASPAVPTISRFFGIVIAMYFDDHGPPHFHARHADGEAKIRIDNLEAIDSTLARRQLRLVLAWAELHEDELLENWRLARAGETLHEIDPLQ